MKNFIDYNGTKSLIRTMDLVNQLASKESEELIQIPGSDINEIWDIVNLKWETEETCPYEIAPLNSDKNWDYTLDDRLHRINLNYYKGTETDVTVYSRYKVNDKIYITALTDAQVYPEPDGPYMFDAAITDSCRSIKSITFKEGIQTKHCTKFSRMFRSCTNLTTINGLEYFDTSNIRIAMHVFYECPITDIPDGIEHWNTSKLYDPYYMFAKTKITNLDKLSNWDVSNCHSLSGMFSDCHELVNADGISSWNPKNTNQIIFLFYYCYKLSGDLDLSSWNTKLRYTKWAFYNTKLSSLDIRNIDISDADWDWMENLFSWSSNLKTILVDRNKWVIPEGRDTTDMFKNCGTDHVTYVN